MKSETAIAKEIRLATSVGASRMFRNHVGKIQDKRTDRWHTFGMATGSSDLVGWTSVVVTQDMVGTKVALFTAIEVKKNRKARRSPDQTNFGACVLRAGGLFTFAWSVEQARALVRREAT